MSTLRTMDIGGGNFCSLGIQIQMYTLISCPQEDAIRSIENHLSQRVEQLWGNLGVSISFNQYSSFGIMVFGPSDFIGDGGQVTNQIVNMLHEQIPCIVDGNTVIENVQYHPDCNTGQGGGGTGPGGVNYPEQTITNDYNLSMDESQYTDDDLSIPDPATTAYVAPPVYTPVHYEYRVTITSGTFTGTIYDVIMYDVVAYPNNMTYYSPTGQNVTRVVTPITLGKSYTTAPHLVNVFWSAEANFRYTYLNTGLTTTRQRSCSYSAPVSVP